jgi:hypothetical protein
MPRMQTGIGLHFVSMLLIGLMISCGSDPAPTELTGVITDVRWNDDHSIVESFLLDSEDEQYEILIDRSLDYGFDLAHLEDHRNTHEPVRVQLREREGDLYAQSIDDA